MIEGCKHGPTYAIPQPCADCERERVEAKAWIQRVGQQIAKIVQEPSSSPVADSPTKTKQLPAATD